MSVNEQLIAEAATSPHTSPPGIGVGFQPTGPADGSLRPRQVVWRKLRRNRTAMASLCVLAILYVASLFAGFLAPYRYDTQDTQFPYHPPMVARIRFFDEESRLRRPFIYGTRAEGAGIRTYRETEEKYPIRLFVRGDRYDLFGFISTDIHLFGVDQPGRLFVLGSDYVGQDLFSRILYGSQISLSIGIVGIIISTAIGMLVGGVAGYFGGVIDFIAMRSVEVLLAVPSIYFILILRQMFPPGLSSTQIYLIIIVILSFIGWAVEARVIRGMVLSIRERDYILAAKALGYKSPRIILRHVLPNTMSFVIVTATLSVPFYILGEVALSFLGVGIQEPEASWGNLLRNANSQSVLTFYPWILIPGFVILLTTLAWNFLGDGLRDATDPRS